MGALTGVPGGEEEMRNYDFLTKKETRMADSGILKIFISYSTKDLDKIKRVLNQLQAIKDIRIFFADETISPGDLVSQTIINNIKNSDVFILFYSESAMKSNYVQQEIGVARSNNKIIIPILLDSNKPTGMLDGINYLNFYDPSKQQAEMGRLYNFIVQSVQSVQSKKKNQILTVLGLLGLGYLLSQSEDDYKDEY
ncbi:MAG: toll/interleukin-1 receptor domain-containing protein [Candidatus Methanoperedens sp.]